MRDEVLTQRRLACDIRGKLHLPRGRIFLRVEADGPDVRWEQSYPTEEEYSRDRAARAASSEFVRATQRMNELIDRFERHVYRVTHYEHRDHRSG
jgi:hypothetical protein